MVMVYDAPARKPSASGEAFGYVPPVNSPATRRRNGPKIRRRPFASHVLLQLLAATVPLAPFLASAYPSFAGTLSAAAGQIQSRGFPPDLAIPVLQLAIGFCLVLYLMAKDARWRLLRADAANLRPKRFVIALMDASETIVDTRFVGHLAGMFATSAVFAALLQGTMLDGNGIVQIVAGAILFLLGRMTAGSYLFSSFARDLMTRREMEGPEAVNRNTARYRIRAEMREVMATRPEYFH